MAWLWLFPDDLRSFSQSLAAVSVFASNMLFWRTSGYFDAATELKPLLHTWSLGVEEQYYVLFPLLLMFCWKLGRRALVAILMIIGLASLVLAQSMVRVDPAGTFYLLPTRGWELLVGALAAFQLSRTDQPDTVLAARQVLGLAGLAAIVVSVFAYDKNTPFPGVYALAPTLGTALIILYTSPQTWVGRWLGSRACVGIGLVSYSAYLWHQPLFALARQRNLEHPSSGVMVALVLLTFGLAYLSWRYVERPFRGGHRFNRRQIFVGSLAGSVFFIVMGLVGANTQLFEGRTSGERARFLKYFENSLPAWAYFERTHIQEQFRAQCDFYDMASYRAGHPSRRPVEHIASDCHVRDARPGPALFIWGDSHAQHLYPGLKQTLPHNWQVLQVTSSGCTPALSAADNPQDYCERSNWFALQAIARARPEVVLIAQNESHDTARMRSLAQALAELGIRRVVFTGPTPHWKSDLPKLVVRNLWDDPNRRTLIGIDTSVLAADAALKAKFGTAFAAEPAGQQVRYISIIDHFCNAEGCLVYLGDDRLHGLTSWDYGHLTPPASVDLARAVLAGAVTTGVE
jgi:peptidoglycan/LPS O-acetylase OafA/YrhL